MPTSLSELAASLDELVPEVLRRTGTPGLSVAAAHGDALLSRAYGWHDVAAGRAMAPESIFPVGSMSKLYTAIAVLQLIEDGLVGLHDPVDAHLDGVRCANPLGARRVTVYDLLTFRSGLAVDTPASSLEPPPPLRDHLARAYAGARGREYAGAAPRWSSRVGERYHYSNLGIATLGLLVEQRNARRLSLSEYLRRRLFEPLGMTATWLSDWRYAEPDPARTCGYACYGGLAIPSPEIRSADFPADGVHTTPREHLRLLRALMACGALDGERILRPESVRLMLTPQVSMEGSDGVWPSEGWQTGLVAILTDLGRHHRRFGHPGAHPWGWWGSAWAYPRLDCAVVVCANGWDMLGWHNPANRDATAVVADAVAAFFGREHGAPARDPRRSWAWKRAFVAGALLAERTGGTLGVTAPLSHEPPPDAAVHGAGWDADGFRAGLLAGGEPPIDPSRAAQLLRSAPDAPPPEQLEALLADLGMAYGCPLPLWMWPEGEQPALL